VTAPLAIKPASPTPKVLWLPDAQASHAQAPAEPQKKPHDSIPRVDPSARPPTPLTDEQPKGATTTYRVAAIGDSLTSAQGGGGKYLRYLQGRCPNSLFDNYGVGGEMVNQMRRRFARDVLDKRIGQRQLPYSHVIVFGGVNDLYSDQTAGRSNEKIQKDLTAMYDAAHSVGMKVVAVAVAPWGGFTRYFNERRAQNTVALNQWMRAQLDTGHTDHWIDAYGLLSCGEPTRLCEAYALPFKDGLHFGTKGHEILGEALRKQAFPDCN
jgi:lysophospholipase L1-like esterase